MSNDATAAKKRRIEIRKEIMTTSYRLLGKQIFAKKIADEMRAIADALDPDCTDTRIVHARNNQFTTTHDPKLSHAFRMIQDKRHPVFFLPINATEVAQSILVIEQKLHELRQKLSDERQLDLEASEKETCNDR